MTHQPTIAERGDGEFRARSTAAGTELQEADPGEEVLVHLPFHWQGVRYEMVLTRGDGVSYVLRVSGDIGTLPFTVEGSANRAGIFWLLGAMGPRDPLWFSLTADRRITINATVEISAPVTTAAMIGALVTMLVRARPYIDLARFLMPAKSNGLAAGRVPQSTASTLVVTALSGAA